MGRRVLIKSRLSHVSDHTDDFAPGPTVETRLHALPNRIHTREELPHQRLTDHDDLWPVGA